MPAERLAPPGLQTRLLLITTVVLITCLSLTGWVLDRTFTMSVLTNAEEQLRLVIYGILGTAEEAGTSLWVPNEPAEPRLVLPESGLYAYITNSQGRFVWQSRSLLLTPPVEVPIRESVPGEFRFEAGDEHFSLAYTVIWEDVHDARFTFGAIADRRPFQARIGAFRRNLLLGLTVVTILFIVAQMLAVRWGLAPVRQMARQVRELEAGDRTRLGESYPRELKGLARNLDRFIVHESESRARYRKAMDDLAHSLKTPVAVLRNALDAYGGRDRELMIDQLHRMETTVSHQLARATAARPMIPGQGTPVSAVVARLVRALEKAYAAKGIASEIDVPPTLRFAGDERDLMELLGNVCENAFKYCRSRVRVAASNTSALTVLVEDDGPGIPEALRREVLARGARADTAETGHGIGLAVVVELASSYGGRLAIEESEWGGAAVRLELPGYGAEVL